MIKQKASWNYLKKYFQKSAAFPGVADLNY